MPVSAKSSQKRRNTNTPKANAIGYEKRQARKAKAKISAADVYEHIEEKTKRSIIRPTLDRGEAWEFGGNIDEASEGQKETLKARLVGEDDDDEEIASDDDEEIDSDDAFEESDEEQFAGFFSSKKSRYGKGKSTVRIAEVDLNEDEEMNPHRSEDSEEDDEEVGEDDEFMNLVDVLDGKGAIDAGSDEEKKSQRGSNRLSSNDVQDNEEPLSNASEDEDEEIDGEDDEDKIAFAPSDDDEVPSALQQLQTFVSSLDVTAKKRKAPDAADGAEVEHTQERTRKRRLLNEKTEAGEENEFNVRSSGDKLNFDDLLGPLAGQSSTLQSLKKAAKILAPSGSAKFKTLSAPLPHRAQERLDREAAYEQTKQEVDKWSDTMKRIREAEHLSFPLQALSSGKTSNLELNAKFKPTTDLERSVDNILKASKLREEDIYEAEDTMLKMNKLSVEEIAQRRNELRRMRELMFRAEIKARRVKKIKSKTYRRLKRKEKERIGELIDEKGLEDDSETEEGRLKREIERATERATLRHKHTGKWAKRMINREDVDEGTRKDIEDMLSRGEKLRRRIQGVASDQSEQESSEDEEIESSNAQESITRIKKKAFDELAELGDQEIAESDEKKTGSSVFEMKFMKEAMARQAATVNKEVDDFTKEMGETLVSENDEKATNNPERESSNGVIAVRTGGRVVYRPGISLNTLSKTNSLGQPPSETSSVTLKSTDLLSPPPPSPLPAKQLQSPVPVSLTQEVNPWLVRKDERLTGKVARTKNAVVVSKDSKTLDKAKHRLDKQASKNPGEREKALDDAALQISLDNVLRLPTSLTVKNAQQDADYSGEDSEVEAQEIALLNGKGKGKAGHVTFQQKDLVALAFAGDNVVQNFEEAKRREITADAPREIDTTIPGWGSWGGAGIRKALPKPECIKVIPGIDPTTRTDHGKKNIIISEKKDKKVAKYLVKDLPYPYASKAQFERAMDIPLGTEWNTRVGFQRGTLPRIVKKPGVIIEPLQKLSS